MDADRVVLAITGSWGNDVAVAAIAEHGEAAEIIAQHVSSSPSWAARDIVRAFHLDEIAKVTGGDVPIVWHESLDPPYGPRETTLAALRDSLPS